MKKTVNQKSLKLDKEIVRALVTPDLQQVQGGRPRETAGSSCWDGCTV